MELTDRPPSTASTAIDPAITPTEHVSADLFVRNYDVEHTYRIRVLVDSLEGSESHESVHTLRPGQAVGEFEVVDPGQYRVRVELDGQRRGFERCRIGASPSETALIEVGNGVVSVDEGLY